MKIHQLPNGARFEYEGDEYVKTGPLLAAGRGGQRLIPRYAVLRPLGEAGGAPPKTAPDALSAARVGAAVEAFCDECRRLLPAERHPALETARGRLLETLGLGPRN